MKKFICLVAMLATVTFSGCSKDTEVKTEVVNTPEATATASPIDMNKAFELMELATIETDREKSIEYAKEACVKAGVEPQILNVQEVSDLSKRNDEIDVLTEALKANNDKASLDRRIELLEEQIRNMTLIIYNSIIMNK